MQQQQASGGMMKSSLDASGQFSHDKADFSKLIAFASADRLVVLALAGLLWLKPPFFAQLRSAVSAD